MRNFYFAFVPLAVIAAALLFMVFSHLHKVAAKQPMQGTYSLTRFSAPEFADLLD